MDVRGEPVIHYVTVAGGNGCRDKRKPNGLGKTGWPVETNKRGPEMHNHLLIHEMVKAIHRERTMTDAARMGTSKRTYMTSNNGEAAGAQYVIGSALVRAGRYLLGTSSARPEPIGS
jgi:hypothetical protein